MDLWVCCTEWRTEKPHFSRQTREQWGTRATRSFDGVSEDCAETLLSHAVRIGQVNFVMRAAQVESILLRHFLHFVHGGFFVCVAANVQNLHAASFSEFFEFDVAREDGFASFYYRLNGGVELRLRNELGDANQEPPLPVFGLMDAEVGSVLGPPLAF